ncbi:hypothetical protein EZ456_13955 [Pedobacter psychrodurus]|uniref:Uncharacterized protein n=1 Tax=Pedobacter psychrodurus TaxID=2530456 RepID=A0A4R0Q537_9SPHI|nr:hypothetical protein [Pedobacter psychrodurus]TCD26395.1 hypothetical protein EZ456_13955 [Pedobacter psychrodurus]
MKLHHKWLCLCLLCSPISVLAQNPPTAGNACYYPNFGQIYQTIYSGNDFVYDNGNGPYTFLACSNKTALQALGTCRVRIPDGQPQGGNYYPGQLFTIIQVIPCDLDGLIYLLIFPSIAMAYAVFRKNLAKKALVL